MASPMKQVCSHITRSVRQRQRLRFGWESADVTPWHDLPPSRHKVDHRQSSQLRAYTQSSQRQASADSGEERTSARTKLDRAASEYEPEDLPSESDLSSTAHAELAQHREVREMVRLAAWEMPLLSPLVKPFQKPDTQTHPLRWRYTTYFGEAHPASRKVVLEFNVDHIQDLTSAQKLKLAKLVGARYNPETGVVRMSSDSFETPAQNKRYLGDVVQKLLAEVRDPDADTFEDIPLDTRHHNFKRRIKFPEAWKMTLERRAELDEGRRLRLLEEGRKVEEGEVIDGLTAIEEARLVQAQQMEAAALLAPRQPLAKGGKGTDARQKSRR